ncbi:MAG TPA: DoxX family protein [Mucilaginibacter sp.]|jgi:uncharacterized membrane protein YphA (DoxX/SURF4 family)
MTDLQIGIYFTAGMLTVVFCEILKSERFVRFMKKLIVAMLAFATLYTLLSLAYFLWMKQLGPSMAGLFMLSLHKIVIFFMDGVIIAWFMARSFFSKTIAKLSAPGNGQLTYDFFRYLMAAYFICTGVSKIIGFRGILVFFQLSGYPALFLYFIIVFEIIFGMGLLFKTTAGIAALALAVEMAGATFTHYHNCFEHHMPGPFSNSLDSLKMLPFLLVIAVSGKHLSGNDHSRI